jgi:hypothetical protein
VARSRAALAYLMPKGDKLSVFVNNKSSQRLGQQFTLYGTDLRT